MPDQAQHLHKMGLFALVGIIFFTVSGGAYGLEPLVSALNPGWAVVFIIVTPLLWSLPTALMVAELASAMPEKGGYYHWVRYAMGDFWGFQEGWWTICYTAVDMAIYPVLFVNYLAYFIPSLVLDENGDAPLKIRLIRWLIAVLVIISSLILNTKGAKAVGNSALVGVMLVLIPFGLLILAGLLKPGAPAQGWQAIKTGLGIKPAASLFAIGLSNVLWNYSAWDNVSTFANEVEEPRKNYPLGLAIALPLIILAYLLPVISGISFTTDMSVWTESTGWPVIAKLMVGNWLGVVVAAFALVSAWMLFNSQLLYVSRLPYAMACDGWLPKFLATTSPKTGVPIVALLISCSITAMFAALSFSKLVVIDILLYAAELSLEFATLYILRVKEPNMVRPFRVPGGKWFAAFLGIPPMLLALTVVFTSLGQEGAIYQLLVVLFFIITGPVIYLIRKRHIKNQLAKG